MGACAGALLKVEATLRNTKLTHHRRDEIEPVSSHRREGLLKSSLDILEEAEVESKGLPPRRSHRSVHLHKRTEIDIVKQPK
jgi:hypothetical protein